MNPKIQTPHLFTAAPVNLGYVRVSTDRQDLSVEAQIEAVKRAAEYHKGDGPPVELQIHEEPDTSGSLPFAARPVGRELLATLRDLTSRGHPVTIIVPKVDRLGRNVIDIDQTVNLFESLDARVLFLDINVDTRTPMGRAFMQISAVFAQLELARIRERIQTVMDHKRAAGELAGSLTYGWNARYFFADGTDLLVTTHALSARELAPHIAAHGPVVKQIVEDNVVEQKQIRRIAHWRHHCGWSWPRIANELNHDRIPTKRGVMLMKLRDGNRGAVQKLTSGQWQCGNVEKILSNLTVRNWLARGENQKAA